MMVIRLKGLKRKFSQDPIDYHSIRKEDVYDPKGRYFRKHLIRKWKLGKTTITEIGKNRDTQKLLLFIHGGAFISGPGQHHWDTVQTIAKNTDFTIWLCNYPKAPEHDISEISQNIDACYDEALRSFDPEQIVCLGDSVGGTLIAALIQRLIRENKFLPKKLVLVSPVMDASLTNSSIAEKDLIDPMLSRNGALSAKKMCVGKGDLQDPNISPLYGSFDGFPLTEIYVAENDIMYPDQLLVIEKMREAGLNLEVIHGRNMPHIWPFLPVMREAREALQRIIGDLNG